MLEFNTPFSLTDVVFPIEIMWRYLWECFLSKFHILMLARSLFNEHNKSSNLLGIVAWSALGKQNRQAKKVYWCGQFGDRDKRNQTCPQNRAYHVVKRKAAESEKMKNARAIKACKTCAFHANYENSWDCCRHPRRGWMTCPVTMKVSDPVISWTTEEVWFSQMSVMSHACVNCGE